MSILNPLSLLSPLGSLIAGGGKKKRDPNTQYSPSMVGGATREPSVSSDVKMYPNSGMMQ